MSADIIFGPSRTAVFVDGCFWHGCPEHYRPAATRAEFWRDKIAQNKVRDERANQSLAAHGWVALRVWEHVDCQIAADMIEAVVLDRRPTTTDCR